MAQGEFTGLTREKRDKLRRDLENLFNKKTQYRKRTGRDIPLTELSKINNEIRKIETQLGIDPSVQSVPSLRDTATGLSLSRYRDPMGNMGEPDNQNFKRGIPSSRTATVASSQKNTNSEVKGKPPARNNAKQKLINLKGTLAKAPPIPKPRPNTNKDMPTSKSNTSYPQTRRLLKRQAEDRLDNPELGYKQFGGLEIGDEEPLAQKTDRSRFRGSASDGEGTSPTDANMNALEKLVSRIIGKEIRFEDIPEDDPFITDMPQNYQNLRRGGQVKRMGHGGAITPEQKKRISRIVQENKARKSKSTKEKATPVSKKRAAPFSDMKKARMNGNKKRTNR